VGQTIGCASMTLAPLFLGRVHLLHCELKAGHPGDHHSVSRGRLEAVTMNWSAEHELSHDSGPSTSAVPS